MTSIYTGPHMAHYRDHMPCFECEATPTQYCHSDGQAIVSGIHWERTPSGAIAAIGEITPTVNPQTERYVMPTPTNLADFMASNVDAVDWRSARDGDVIQYLDPRLRDSPSGYAYVIDGVPSHERGAIVAWTKRIDDHAIPHMRSTAIKREFACTVFQVWRRFPTPEELTALSSRVVVGDAS